MPNSKQQEVHISRVFFIITVIACLWRQTVSQSCSNFPPWDIWHWAAVIRSTQLHSCKRWLNSETKDKHEHFLSVFSVCLQTLNIRGASIDYRSLLADNHLGMIDQWSLKRQISKTIYCWCERIVRTCSGTVWLCLVLVKSLSCTIQNSSLINSKVILKASMKHNVTNGVSESLCAHSLSQNLQMASNHHTSRLFISELHSWQELSLAQSCCVITKVYKLHLFLILARALLETVRSYSLEAHTRFINTVCITYAVICIFFPLSC